MALASVWSLELFGRPRLTGPAGRRATLPKKAFILALRLIVEAPSLSLDRDEAASFLWPHSEPERRLNSLRTLLKRIRAAQAAAGAQPLVIEPNVLRFDAKAVECDALAALNAIRTEDPVELVRLAPLMTRGLLEGCENEAPASWLWLNDWRRRLAGEFAKLARRFLVDRAHLLEGFRRASVL